MALRSTVIGGVVGVATPPPPRFEEELLLLAASIFDAAHISSIVEVAVAESLFALVFELSLVMLGFSKSLTC